MIGWISSMVSMAAVIAIISGRDFSIHMRHENRVS